MKLTADQIGQFKTEGYAIAHHFFARREVVAMQAALSRLIDAGKLRNVATDGDGKTHSTTKTNLQICPVSPHSDLFRSLPFSQKIRDAVRLLIGQNFVLQLDQIFLKPARQGTGTSWHQDNAYFQIPNPGAGTGMWIALHDAEVENGTMHIVPRSHERLYDHERDMGSDHHIVCEVDEEKDCVLPVEMAAGGVLFFNYGIAHCTKGNHTDSGRAGLGLHFLRSDLVGVNGASGLKRAVLSGLGYTRGQEEYGQDMEGQWESQVAMLASDLE